MSDNNWEIKDPSSAVLNALAVDCFDMNRHMPIEHICSVLYTQYSYDELRVMEAEFILQALKRLHPDKEMDSLFIEKLYAVTAILNNPELFTSGLTPFFNAVCICNDIPAGTTDIHDVPCRYLPRTIAAVNAMLPDDMDFKEAYLYTNVKNYIFNMYRKEDCPVLDPCFGYLQREFNTFMNSVSRRDYLDEFTDRVAVDCEDIYQLMDKFRAEADYKLMNRGKGSSGFPVQYKLKYSRLENALLKKYEHSPFETFMVKKHLACMLYDSLYPLMSSGLDMKSDIWIINPNPGLTNSGSLIYNKIKRFLEKDSRNAVYLLVSADFKVPESITGMQIVPTEKKDTVEQIKILAGEHAPPDNIIVSFLPAEYNGELLQLKKEYEEAGSVFDIAEQQ